MPVKTSPTNPPSHLPKVDVDSEIHTAYIFEKGYECYGDVPADECDFFVVPIVKGVYEYRIWSYDAKITETHFKILESFKIY